MARSWSGLECGPYRVAGLIIGMPACLRAAAGWCPCPSPAWAGGRPWPFVLDLTGLAGGSYASDPDAGAARVAFNWGLGRVKANLGQREAEKSYGITDLTPALSWSMYSLRKDWNQAKGVVAPWWAENSKEAYAGGLANLATALQNWRDSKTGKRKGPRMGFPRFKSKHKSRLSCRFTTGCAAARPRSPARRRCAAGACPAGGAGSAAKGARLVGPRGRPGVPAPGTRVVVAGRIAGLGEDRRGANRADPGDGDDQLRQVQLAGDLHHAGFHPLHFGQCGQPAGAGEVGPLGQGVLLCLDTAG